MPPFVKIFLYKSEPERKRIQFQAKFYREQIGSENLSENQLYFINISERIVLKVLKKDQNHQVSSKFSFEIDFF